MDIDDKIRLGFKLILLSGLALLLSPIVVMLVVRNRSPNAERQAALDLLHQPTPPVRGRDGSDALWLLDYDVPVADQPSQAAKLRRYLEAYDRLVVAKRESEARKLQDPRTSLTRFTRFNEEPAWSCAMRALGCLDAVRRDPAAAAAAVSANAHGLAAVERLSRFDGTRFGLSPSMSQELPQWGLDRQLVYTRHALDFIQGRQLEAIAAVCREAAGWRRQGADTDMLVGSMVGAANVSQDLQLLSEMLAEMPPATALPPDCDAALAPTRSEELDLCAAVRMEFAQSEEFYTRQMQAGLTPGAKRLSGLMFDVDHALAILAPTYAAYCRAPFHDAARSDLAVATAHPPRPRCGWLERVGDPMTCWMVEVSGDFTEYQDRRTDLAAKIALMRTLLWARSHGAYSQAGFDRRPAGLGLRRQPLVSSDASEVSIPTFDTRADGRFRLQLAPAPKPD